MKKEYKKQVILIVLAFIFVGIGYINFRYQYKSIEVSTHEDRNEIYLGDVQLVNSEIINNEIKVENQIKEKTGQQTLENQNIKNEEKKYMSEIVSNEELMEIQNKNSEKYFIETRLQRDSMNSEMLEIYQKMLENPEIGETQKVIATQEITNINNMKNGIMIAENLIKNKGFQDVVILLNNGVVSVVVKSALLNQEQIAQIQNIVSRELNVEMQNIHITKK